MYRGTLTQITADFSSETMKVRRQWNEILKALTEADFNQEFYIR